jgi:DNA-binding NarL/FixJ family response regulator
MEESPHRYALCIELDVFRNGGRFMLKLPLRRRTSRPRVLVVDGDEEFAREVAVVLEREYEVIAEPDSAGALRRVAECSVACAILEIVLPPFLSRGGEEEGLALIRLLHQEHQIPILVATQSDDADDMAEARQAGALEVASKRDLTPERLLKCVKAVLHGGSARCAGSAHDNESGSPRGPDGKER